MYKFVIPLFGQTQTTHVLRLSDGAFIPFDPANTDYQAYLKWLAEGNEPLQPDNN